DGGGLGMLVVNREHEEHAGLPGEVLHQLRGRAVGDQLGVGVVLRILDLAEVRPVEELLEEHHLGALLLGLVRRLDVLLDHRLLVAGPARLQQRPSNDPRHSPALTTRNAARLWVFREGRERTPGRLVQDLALTRALRPEVGPLVEPSRPAAYGSVALGRSNRSAD